MFSAIRKHSEHYYIGHFPTFSFHQNNAAAFPSFRRFANTSQLAKLWANESNLHVPFYNVR